MVPHKKQIMEISVVVFFLTQACPMFLVLEECLRVAEDLPQA
jgi:hypothetical protein